MKLRPSLWQTVLVHQPSDPNARCPQTVACGGFEHCAKTGVLPQDNGSTKGGVIALQMLDIL